MTSTDALSLPDLAHLPDDVGVLKELVAQLCETLVKERAETVQLRQNFDLLLKRVWGPKSEKTNDAQLPLFDTTLDPATLAALTPTASPSPEEQPEERSAAKTKQGAHGRRRCPDTLAREVVTHDLTDAEKILLGGAACLKPLEDQVTTQYEWTPSSLFIVEHHQKKYARIEPAAHANHADDPAHGAAASNVAATNAGVTNIDATNAAVSTADTLTPTAAAPVAERKKRRVVPSAAERAATRVAQDLRDELTWRTAALFASAIIVAPKPAQAIPGGQAGPGLLAQTIICKYVDHLPLHRLERIYARHGVRFARSTTCDWCAACAKLLRPLADLIRAEVLKSFVIHTDDTPVNVRGPRTREKYQARFWPYWGDEEHRLVWFDFTKSRKRAGPDEVLRDFRGYLQADGYGGYDDYEGVELSDASPILKVACWVHARRKFREARSSERVLADFALAYIRRLYAIEKQIEKKIAAEWRELSIAELAPKIAQQRKAEALPVMNEFKKWMEELRKKPLLPKSPLAKAITYALNQWDALARYVEDGRLDPDNNAAERALRGIAIGRKNWLFCGSEQGGRTAAVCFTIIGSALRNGLEPYAYLRHLLEQLPLLGESPTPDQLRPFLPTVWQPPQK